MSLKTRRRGAALEAAILDAAWEQLTEFGYTRFTIEAVAERAGTSRPVLYRRWPTRADLLLAAVRHTAERTRPAVPDTGSLRDDLITYLTRASQSFMGGAVIMISAQAGAFFRESGMTPETIRREVIGKRPNVMDRMLERAVARGEAPPDLPERLRDLPFDLLRGEVMMTMRPPAEDVVVAIVDEIFLPLVRLRLGERSG